MPKKPFIREKKELARSRFLALTEVHFTDEFGRERRWDSTERVNSQGAVIIIARFAEDDSIVLVRQFRPPAGRFLIEFPAGLIDPGEAPEETAHRELWEETGYTGEILHVYPPAYTSPGLSGETVTIVEMQIPGSSDAEAPQSHQEDSENIETLLVSPREFDALFQQAQEHNWGFDAKVLVLFRTLLSAAKC